ncbi:SixA phosphatase family protein [Nesterenkonia populi]|uniref:SixA phosphatase family protein n=1 Tax=Nesterenkonia populi TaxID=1591087 RepID=UPI0011BD64A8|nr:histidine phosphatase family protein [Nesterenkonia populi]
MKKLLVLRHAEAGMSFTGEDRSRNLTAHGQEQARGVGQLLLEEKHWPEVTLVSDAMRTRQTAIWIGSVMGERGTTPYLDSRLYLGDSRTLGSVVNETPETAETLLLIAHMPGVQELSMELASMASEERAVLSMAEHWPPGGLAIFTFDGPWAELDHRNADLQEFRRPAF